LVDQDVGFYYFGAKHYDPESVGVEEEPRNRTYLKPGILSKSYLNPFNSVTRIRYGLPKDTHVRLTIYNISGQRVCTLVDEEDRLPLNKLGWKRDGQSIYGVTYE